MSPALTESESLLEEAAGGGRADDEEITPSM